MSVDENVAIMRRWFQEVWNEGKTQTIHDLLAVDAVGIGELEDGSPLRGPAEFIPFVQRIRGAFPDIQIEIDDIFGGKDGENDASRTSSGHARHRQACANDGNHNRPHRQRPDRRGMGQLRPTRNAKTDRRLRTFQGHPLEDCIGTQELDARRKKVRGSPRTSLSKSDSELTRLR
jgi:SnoaL-like polyketide cyclase